MSRQPEQILEEQLVAQLQKLGYGLILISDEKELIANLKLQLEKHNNIKFSNAEFEKVMNILSKGYTDDGLLNIPHLNNAIFLAELQYDSIDIDFIIPKGKYNVPNNQTVNIKSHIHLRCDSVTFVYKWKTDSYPGNLISFYWVKSASINNITLDLTQAYKDKKPSYSNADKFSNRSVIQIEGSSLVDVDSVLIKKILGCGIELSNSKVCQVTNCNMQGSWIYGNETGTQGYGIDLVGTLCSDNVIFNNTLQDMRHNIVIQYGAHHNVIYANKLLEVKALKKLWFIEIMDKAFTFNLTLHGNNPHDNLIQSNYCDWRLCVDNVKVTGNGPGNQIINNFVMGLLSVESKPPYDYNSGQIVTGNKFGSLSIEANNCTIENNTKIK